MRSGLFGGMLCLGGLLVAASAWAQNPITFDAWLKVFAEEAWREGISQGTLDRTLPHLAYDESVIELDRKQPEGKITLARYMANTITPARVKQGQERLAEHRQALDEAQRLYGVPPAVIVALWGIESSFGANTGDYDVVNSLATLAYDGRRADFFKKELLEALRVIDEESRESVLISGSWAGAMGQSQFMPSTYRRFAVDADGDGRRDIWTEGADLFASMARYLASEGWVPGQTWGQEVQVPASLTEDLMGLEVIKPVSFWQEQGVQPIRGARLAEAEVRASLIRPDGPGGRSFLVYDNFRALMRWNRSTYFATSVGWLADNIAAGS